MSREVRCKCGWCGQVSEAALAGTTFCPDCGEALPGTARSVPYGYPPLPTWPSRQPKPRRVPAPVPLRDGRTANSEGWSALVFSVCALWLAGSGCFAGVASVVFGGLALSSGFRSRLMAAQENKPRPFKALLAIVFAIIALVISATSFTDLRRSLSENRCGGPICVPKQADHNDAEVFYFEGMDPLRGCEAEEAVCRPATLPAHDLESISDAREDWESFRHASAYGDKAFDRWQHEYSNRVADQRSARDRQSD